MPQFFVKDNGVGIDGAKVVVRRDSDGAVILSSLTDSTGKVDLTLPADVPHTLLAYKTGSYDGVRVSIQYKNGVLYPASVSLLKVTQRIFKLRLGLGTPTNALAGASLQVKDASNVIQATASTDAGGGWQVNLPANLTGWTVSITAPGIDGVVIPLDKIDLLGTVVVTLAPLVGVDE